MESLIWRHLNRYHLDDGTSAVAWLDITYDDYAIFSPSRRDGG